MTDTELQYGSTWLGLMGLVLLGVLSVIGWQLQKRHRYWLWLALGHWGMAAWWWLWLSQAGMLSAIWLGLWCIVAAAWPHAMLTRLGLRLPLGWVAGVAAVGMLAWQIWVSARSEVTGCAQALWLLGAWAVVWLPACVQAWQTPHRHMTETRLWMAACACVSLALVIALGGGLAWYWELWLPQEQHSPWHTLVAMNVAAGLAWNVGLLACWASDGHWRWRRDGQPAGAQGLLSREAFEAACGDVPYTHGIRVMVLCDIDDMPQLRQQYGAAAAQQITQQFGRILRQTLREGDWLGHLGEEEFALALRHVPLQGSVRLIARVRQRMARTEWLGGQAVTVTASFGVVQVQAHDRRDWLLHRADVWLYLAKDAGHNQVRGDGMEGADPKAAAAA